LRYNQALIRRSIAILLALIFSWMLMLPVFASQAQGNLPACCRKNGKHHCMMLDNTAATGSAFAAIGGKCTYLPTGTPANHSGYFGLAAKQAIFAGIVSHPSVSPQTAAGYRASYYRSKQKRGPPTLFLS
jgi:hypothetical protein